MTFNQGPFPPKILNWSSQIKQHYSCKFDLLITSGCSFTASTACYDYPLSWPGIVKDRCNIPLCIDLSYPGVGNEYIANSVLVAVEDQLAESPEKNILVLISWSGLDRKEDIKVDKLNENPQIDGISYQRTQSSQNTKNYDWYMGEIWRTWKNIILVKNYLENKKIAHGFVFYCNLFDPPFLPKRDRTPEWPGMINQRRLHSLQQIPWVIPHNQSMFEFCFDQDFLAEDLFHPNQDGVYAWTDQVLLPGLQKQGIIRALDQ
jgi:hypothetical protein